MTAGGWHGQLALAYRSEPRDGRARTVAHDRHAGPLRVLQALYPEGPGICHHVIVHPPGGIVGGDELAIEARLEPAAHALVTTPGASRFYRSDGAVARLHTRLQLATGARLEWLPLETIAYPGCLAEATLVAELEPGAEMIGWDLLVLGLAAAGQPFAAGRYRQHLELPGRWLERGRIDAGDRGLLEAPLGWAGRSVLGTAWFAAGGPLVAARREALLEAARAGIAAHALAATAGVTALDPGLLVFRVLAHQVEPAMGLLAAVRAAWRGVAWQLDALPPRIWRT